jgi:ferredoxin
MKDAEILAKAAETPEAKKVFVIKDVCISCSACVSACPTAAIEVTDVAHVDRARCIGDGACVAECPVDAFAFGPEDERSSGKA